MLQREARGRHQRTTLTNGTYLGNRRSNKRALKTETPQHKNYGESEGTAEGRTGSRASAELFSPRKGGVVTGRCNRAYDDHGQPDLARQNSHSRKKHIQPTEGRRQQCQVLLLQAPGNAPSSSHRKAGTMQPRLRWQRATRPRSHEQWGVEHTGSSVLISRREASRNNARYSLQAPGNAPS